VRVNPENKASETVSFYLSNPDSISVSDSGDIFCTVVTTICLFHIVAAFSCLLLFAIKEKVSIVAASLQTLFFFNLSAYFFYILSSTSLSIFPPLSKKRFEAPSPSAF